MGQNIVQNPSFEISGGTAVGGVAADWNCFNGDPNAVISLDTTNPHTGAQDLYMNNTDSGGYGLYMYQDTPAGSVTPGSTYTFNFYAAGATGNGGVGIYDIRWGGATGIIDDTGGQVYFPNSTTYSQYGNMKYTAPAGATYAEIAFTTATGAVTGSYSQIMIDDVSLTAPATSTTGVSQWNLAGAGQWDLGANWTNGYPNGIGAEADLLSSTTGTNGITANHSIYADVPITLGTLNFNNTNTYVVTGAGSLTMQNSTGAATVIVQAGTQKISLPLTFASNGNFNVSSGATLLVSNPLTIDPGVAVTTIGAGTVTYQAPITIGAGGSLSMSAPAIANALALIGNSTASATSASGHSLVQFDSLTLDTTSTYDLANNDMLIHGASLATVTGYLATGYNGGKWNGVGIASSAAASDTAHLTALGVIQATAPGTFEGAAVSTGDVLVKYTYYGDTNLDGKVDGSDYSKVDYGYLHQLGGWANGDFNYDGIVNGSDYTLIDNAFNQQSGVISDQLASATAQIASSSAVPEPGTLGIFSIGTAALLRRRRRIEA
jgi:hypothetical protein